MAPGDTPSFERYRVILDRKPFGEPPPPPPAPPPQAIPAAQSFARNLRLVALVEDDDGNIEVGVMNTQNNSSFYLRIGEIEDGIELLSANYEEESAVLKKDAEIAVVTFTAGDLQTLTADQAQTHIERGLTGYAERRRQREEARRQRMAQMEERARTEPQLTGEDLERHLRDYQMEVIRQGLPPLPIPLTEEMDAQLVAEGYLPPMEEEDDGELVY